jgi:hypothetical protein
MWKGKCDGWKINYGSRAALISFFLSSFGRWAMVIHYNGTEINSEAAEEKKAFYMSRG